MKYFNFLASLIVLFIACEKSSPDPCSICDPSKFYPNQTILDSITPISIAFDHDGTAWIGTLNKGLVKYGLTQTKIFDSLNSPIKNTAIWDIAVDSKNNVWIGTHGLVKYAGEEFIIYNTSNSAIPEDFVMSIAVDSKDDIWISSSRHREGGIAKYDGEGFHVYTPENSALPVNLTHGIAVDANDNIWCAASQTVHQAYLVNISGDSWTVFDETDFGQPISWIRNIETNSKNQICGVIYYLSGPVYQTPHAFIFDGTTMEFLALDSLRHGLNTIMVDRNDGLWFSDFWGYYHYYNGAEWISERVDEYIGVIAQAPSGNIWIGTSNGIIIIKER